MSDRRPRKRDGLSERLVAGERVVLDPESESMHQLNLSATVVWELCDGDKTVTEIAKSVAEQFEIAEDVALDDVEQAVKTFDELGLLVS